MSNIKKIAPKLDADLAKKLESIEQMSSKIRLLNASGFERGDIARILNIRYQWVRNVLITPLQKK